MSIVGYNYMYMNTKSIFFGGVLCFSNKRFFFINLHFVGLEMFYDLIYDLSIN